MYRVLLVDDEEMVTQGLTRFGPWKELDFEVAGTANSVSNALKFLEKEHVDLIITDVQMPVQTGINLLEILNETHAEIKTIILSGYSEFSYAQQALRLGAIDYLTKPINFGAMKTVLAKARQKLDETNQKPELDPHTRELLAHTMIMNITNGLPYDEAKMASYLDVQSPVTVIRITSNGKQALPENLQRSLKLALAPCHLMYASEGELLCVVEGVQQKLMFSTILNNLVQEATQYNMILSIGVSDQMQGYSELRHAAIQAGKSMRYQKARSVAGVIYYDMMREMYLSTTDDSEEMISHLVSLLATPEQRTQLISEFTGFVSVIESRSRNGIISAQRFCTEFLVELDTPVEQLVSADYPRHTYLSRILMDILVTDNMPDLVNYMANYLQALLDEVSHADEAQQAVELIDRIKSYITDHYAENLTLSVLSEKFYVCPAHLSRIFKKKTGVNFVDYLTTLRMEKAREFLDNSDLKIYNIAEMVGYDNPRYFSRLFKAATGYTPQEYRANKQAESE